MVIPRSAALAAAWLGLVLASPAGAVTYWTLSSDTMTGFFFGATASGTFTTGAKTDTSTITLMEASGIGYTFTGPVGGPGWTQPSQQPNPPCIIGPCTFPPTFVTFSLGSFSGPGPVLSSVEDAGEIATGAGILTATTSSAPEPETWMLIILGVVAAGGAMRGVRGPRRSSKSRTAVS